MPLEDGKAGLGGLDVVDQEPGSGFSLCNRNASWGQVASLGGHLNQPWRKPCRTGLHGCGGGSAGLYL